MILLDLKDSRPIYEQVVERLQELMMLGILEEDSQMPSVRSLAMELSINPNTIQRAYGELERKGYTYSVKGRGSFVGSIRKLREAKKTELERKLGGLAKEAKTVGILREEFISMAGQAYEKGPENVDRTDIGREDTGRTDTDRSKTWVRFDGEEGKEPKDNTAEKTECPDKTGGSQKAKEISGESLWVRNE